MDSRFFSLIAHKNDATDFSSDFTLISRVHGVQIYDDNETLYRIYSGTTPITEHHKFSLAVNFT